MKLISSTDFTLEKKKGEPFLRYNHKQCLNYANFLKRPLELGMFIPCDKEGNVLKKPNVKRTTPFNSDIARKYQEAKERVLFEGFVTGDFGNNGIILFSGNTEVAMTLEDGLTWGRNEETIEDLIRLDFTLTETAINQIR
jgi:hypothetical protein